jgi:hypothetical protein
LLVASKERRTTSLGLHWQLATTNWQLPQNKETFPVAREGVFFVSRPKLEPGLKLLRVMTDSLPIPSRSHTSADLTEENYFFLVVFLAVVFLAGAFLAAAFFAMALYLLSSGTNVERYTLTVNDFFPVAFAFFARNRGRANHRDTENTEKDTEKNGKFWIRNNPFQSQISN